MTAAATATDFSFPDTDTGYIPHLRQEVPPDRAAHGDLTPLTLADILPFRTATATEPLDSWQSSRELKDGIIEDLTIRHEATG